MRKQIEERASAFARRICDLCEVIRKRPNGYTTADQLHDAATSTAANYRAAGRGRSRKEFISKLGIANEEADETVYWLEHIQGTALGKDLDIGPLLVEAGELRAIIAASYSTAKRNNQATRDKPRTSPHRRRKS
jgi:four helix bundle protein